MERVAILIISICIFCLSGSLFSQDFLSGRVVDQEGDYLVGVSVFVKVGSQIKSGTVTDINGWFELEVEKADSLTFSYLGFKKIVYSIDELQIDNLIVLRNEGVNMPEVVVNGFKIPFFKCRLTGCGFRDDIDKSHVSKEQSFSINTYIFGNDVISCFPNPTSGLFSVVNRTSNEMILELINTQGILMQSMNLGTQPMTISLMDYPDGLYYIRRIESNTIKIFNKIIKHSP